MKILYVCKALPYSFKGGVQTHVWKLSEWMHKMGHEVHILTAGGWRKGIQKFEMEGRHIIEIPIFPGRKIAPLPHLADELAFNLGALRWLKNNATAFDVVHLQGRSGYFFPKRAKSFGIPTVTTLHGLIDVENEKSGEIVTNRVDYWLHTYLTKKFERQMLRHSTVVVAVSKEMKRVTLERRGKDLSKKIQVISNGVDLPVQVNQREAEASKKIVFVGRLSALKGIFPLVESLQYTESDVQLMIVGKGPSMKKLEQYIQKLNLKDRVELTGPLDSEEVFKAIQDSAGLILPSFYETQGIVLLEANACGKAVIASEINGINEVVHHHYNGILIPPNNPKEIAKAMDYLVAHPEEASQMGSNGLRMVEKKFQWRIIAQKVEQLYQSLVNQPEKTITKTSTKTLAS